MVSPAAVPATPPTFHFKIRLVDAAGTVFAGKDYRLWWGGKVVKEGQTTSAGVVEADVDDNFDSGLLDLGELGQDKKFIARLTIPIDVVPPPPPPPRPFAPPKNRPLPKKTPAQGPQWTDEADPPPPMPVYPRSGEEDEEGMRRYREQQKKLNEWEARREEGGRDARQQQRASEDIRDQQKAEGEIRRQYRQGGGPGTPEVAGDAPATPMSAEDKQELLDRVQRYRNEAHAAKVLAYELSWRLRNLGYLPDSTVLFFPLEGSALEKLLDAQRRYAHKHPPLELPEYKDVVAGQDSECMKMLSEAIKKEHDG